MHAMSFLVTHKDLGKRFRDLLLVHLFLVEENRILRRILADTTHSNYSILFFG